MLVPSLSHLTTRSFHAPLLQGGVVRNVGNEVESCVENGGRHVVKSSFLTIKQRHDGSNESDQVPVRQIVFNKLSCGERK